MPDLSDANQRALHVKPGCKTPAPPKPVKRVSTRERDLSAGRIVEGILKGDRSLLAKAITLVESSRPEDRRIAEQIIEKCLPASGNSVRVGVTGVPGAGKSSLIEALGKYLITRHGEKVAVLAIDPSSQLSGGSILGDKTRMTFLASSEMTFIRPSPSRCAHGGVAQRTREAILLCEAAGYRNILVETVGVGQAETAVRDMVDFFLLVTLAGAGDELQGIKRGVMEMADVVAVNKADAENIAAAERARTDAENALHFLPSSPSGWIPRAFVCSARTGRGIAELWDSVLDYAAITKASGWFKRTRQKQDRRSLDENLQLGLMQMFLADPAVRNRLAELEPQLLAGGITAVAAARDLLALFPSKAAGC